MGQKHSVPLSVDSKPSKKKLVELIPHVAPHWYLIGIQLLREDQESLLDVIKADHGHDKIQSCTEMFCLWLKSHPNASWRQLIGSLRSPAVQLHSVAADIETMITGKPNTTIASKLQGEIAQPDFYKFKNVSLAFVSLTSSVARHLENQDFSILRRACIAQIDSPDGAKLPADVVDKIQNAENLKTLLDVLTATKYWNWIDLRLLEALVVASGSSAAQDIIDKYKAAVYSKKLIEILQNAPSKETRDAYFTKIVSKVNKNPEEVTVADLIEFRSKLETVIMEINKGTCALEHISNGSIEIHWYMPTHHIDHAYEAACLQRHKFHELHLVYLQIGNKPVIYDSQVVHSSRSVLLKPSPPVTADTSKDVIDHFYHYLSIGLNTDLIFQYLLTQHLLNDEEVDNLKNANSRYQKNCLLLEKMRLMNMEKLESLCKLLQSFDSQRHIGNVLMDAFQLLEFSTVEPLPEPSRVQDPVDSKNAQTNLVSGRSNGKSDVSRKRRLSSEQHTGVKYFKPSSVTAEFLNVREQLEDILQGSDTQKMLVEFRGLMASGAHNIHLVSDEEYLQSLNECKFAPEMLQKLSPFFTWSDHSVLTAVVKACDKAEADSLLQQFDSHVDLSLPITEYPVPQPIPSMAPYNTSTQTVLAVKVNTELNKFSFQQVIELRHLIQKNFEITGHSLQLLAAKSSSTILYWIIPKCIGHLINSKIMQDHSLHASRVEELSIYPGTLFVKVSNLNLGSLSFLSQINDTLREDEHEVLSTQLSHLEQLPNVMRILQFKNESVKESEVQKHNVMVQTESSDQFDQSELISIETSQPSSSEDLKAILKHVNSQNLELRTQLKKCKSYEKALEQQISKTEEKYSDLNEMYEKLKLLSNAEQVEDELISMQRKLINIKSGFQCLDIIKTEKQYDEEIGADSTKLIAKKEEIIFNYFQNLNKHLDTLEEWSKLLQEELMNNKKTVNNLQEEHKRISKELSEYKSELMVKDNELSTLKEENRLLVKQFRQKKEAQKKREQILQELITKKESLGSGQFGSVSKIVYSDKLYAGKSLYPNLVQGYPNSSVDQIKQFIKELESKAIVYSYFTHPNVELFEASVQLTSENIPMLLTELLPENLEMFTARMKGNLPIHQQLDLCDEIAKGLQYLHDAGLVHTNLHSRNVLISRDGHAKVGDYICPQVISSSGEIASKDIPYLPPEAIKGKSKCNELSDVYSLGVLFLQIATQNIPEPTDNTELSKISKRKEELAGIKHHPLSSIIYKCISNIKSARPSITQVLGRMIIAKESPQSVLSYSVYSKESLELGHSLQSKRYKLQWTSCSKLPTAMKRAQATVINSTLYISGGDCPNDTRNIYNVYKYEFDKDQWNVLPRLRQFHGVPVSVNDLLTIIGGKDSHNKVINWVVTFSDNRWKSIYPNLSVARWMPAVVPYHQYVIVVGGKSDDGSLLDSIEVFNSTTSNWIIINTHLPEPMWCISATMCADSIIIVGYSGVDGYYNGTYMIAVDDIISNHQQTQQSLTSSTDNDNTQWHRLADAPYWKSALVPNTSPPVIIGGEDEQFNTVNDITIYDDTSDGWKKISTAPINCTYTTVAVINQSIIVMGGCRDSKNTETANATALSDVNIGQLVPV